MRKQPSGIFLTGETEEKYSEDVIQRVANAAWPAHTICPRARALGRRRQLNGDMHKS
jgi:hypothetical protein